MTDPRALADEAVHHLDRLGSVILDDVGEGPPATALAAHATAARNAIGQLGVTALTQLTGLVAGVADSMVAGTTEWSPSLGGTLLAAIDDVRHLVGRAAQFNDEDTEHLHHRAAELSVYVRRTSGATPAPSAPEPPSPSSADLHAPATTAVVPISQLFFSGQGPHIVSGGVSESASKRSDLLGRGIDALDHLTTKPLATPITVGVTAVVPVEKLLYRGRAALERAAAIREQIKSSPVPPTSATLDEMFDLIGLALKD